MMTLTCATALLVIARRWWPVAALVALLLAGWLHGQARYRAGMADCNARHAIAAAAQQAADQSRVDLADAAGAKTQANIDRVERHYVEKVREIYRDKPARPCLDAAGVDLVRAADTNAAPAGGAAGISPDAMRGASPGEDDG